MIEAKPPASSEAEFVHTIESRGAAGRGTAADAARAIDRSIPIEIPRESKGGSRVSARQSDPRMQKFEQPKHTEYPGCSSPGCSAAAQRNRCQVETRRWSSSRRNSAGRWAVRFSNRPDRTIRFHAGARLRSGRARPGGDCVRTVRALETEVLRRSRAGRWRQSSSIIWRSLRRIDVSERWGHLSISSRITRIQR